MKKKIILLLMTTMMGAAFITGCRINEKKDDSSKQKETSKNNSDNKEVDENSSITEEEAENAITDYIAKSKRSQDLTNMEYIERAFKSLLADEICYREFIASEVRELVFTDVSSAKVAGEKIGSAVSENLYYLLEDLTAPKSKGAKEYIVTWELSENCQISDLQCNIRCEDGTIIDFAVNND